MELTEIRNELDKVDEELIRLFMRRMKLCEQVAYYKEENKLPVLDSKRELQKLASVEKQVDSAFDKEAVRGLFEYLMSASRKLQNMILSEKEDGREK